MKFETDWMTLACDFHNKKCCTIIKVRENAINISHFSSLGCSLKFLSINLDYHVRVSLKFRITWNVNHVNHRNCQSRSTDFSEMCQRNVSANSAKNENGKDPRICEEREQHKNPLNQIFLTDLTSKIHQETRMVDPSKCYELLRTNEIWNEINHSL